MCGVVCEWSWRAAIRNRRASILRPNRWITWYVKRKATIIWPYYTRAGHRGSERTTAGACAPRWLDIRLIRYSNSYRRTCVVLRRRRRHSVRNQLMKYPVKTLSGKQIGFTDRSRIDFSDCDNWKLTVPCADFIIVSKTRLTRLRSIIHLGEEVTSVFFLSFLLKGAKIMSLYNIERMYNIENK